MIDMLFYEIESLEKWVEYQGKHLCQGYCWLGGILLFSACMCIYIYEGYGSAIFDISCGGMIYNFFFTLAHLRNCRIDYRNDCRRLRKLKTYQTKERIEAYEQNKEILKRQFEAMQPKVEV